MRLYIELAKKWFQWSLAYRMEYLVSLLSNTLVIYISISIWKALYRSSTEVDGISLAQMITYSTVSVLMGLLIRMDVEHHIMSKIRTGEIVFDLSKPFDFHLSMLFRSLGMIGFNLLMKLIPCGLIAGFLFRVNLSVSFDRFLFFILSLLLGFIVLFSISFLLGVACFWMQEVWGLILFKESLVRFFSGAVVPLWFFPGILKKLALILPFKAIYYLPLSIYVEKTPMEGVWFTLLQQAIWAIALILFGRFLLKILVKNLTVQGG